MPREVQVPEPSKMGPRWRRCAELHICCIDCYIRPVSGTFAANLSSLHLSKMISAKPELTAIFDTVWPTWIFEIQDTPDAHRTVFVCQIGLTSILWNWRYWVPTGIQGYTSARLVLWYIYKIVNSGIRSSAKKLVHQQCSQGLQPNNKGYLLLWKWLVLPNGPGAYLPVSCLFIHLFILYP